MAIVILFLECQTGNHEGCPERFIEDGQEYLCSCPHHTEAALEELKNRREEK